VEELLKLRGKRVLVLGVGGGGDVASAYLIYSWLEALGAKAWLGGVAWERFPIDPQPGPISLSELSPVKPLSKGLGWAFSSTIAKRGARLVRPQVARIAKLVGGRALAVDLWLGPARLAEGLREAAGRLKLSSVVGVDVGGDALAKGPEGGLWSPLADQVMLACLAKLKEAGLEALLAIHGLGVDGELDVGYLVRRLGEVAAAGGYLGAVGMGRDGAEALRRALSTVVTESSALTLEAFRGVAEARPLRWATRRAKLSVLSSLTFLLDPLKVFELSPMARSMAGAASLEEANERLHELGVYTELDLERDLYEVWRVKGRVGRADVLAARREGLRRLREARAEPRG
jgi:hypothetical protein